MKEIDQKLDQWIYNSVVRAEVRNVIIKAMRNVENCNRCELMDWENQLCQECYDFYKLNTNEDG